jgi:hypothetical protein
MKTNKTVEHLRFQASILSSYQGGSFISQGLVPEQIQRANFGFQMFSGDTGQSHCSLILSAYANETSVRVFGSGQYAE